jgi:hypothetical protein
MIFLKCSLIVSSRKALVNFSLPVGIAASNNDQITGSVLNKLSGLLNVKRVRVVPVLN